MNVKTFCSTAAILLCGFSLAQADARERPRVFVFTDINIDAGDPDDRQSLVHLLWYANELTIEGIVPERWGARGHEACGLAIEAYASDYPRLRSFDPNYPTPASLRAVVAANNKSTREMLFDAASRTEEPLYVLVWGGMKGLRNALSARPEVAANIRVISIGTGLMHEKARSSLSAGRKTRRPCEQPNWNGAGRDDIYNDDRFDEMWWLEINWTYEGMFRGPEPAMMLEKLGRYGELGDHLRSVVDDESWARYFRVGDTPSVLYLIDEGHDPDDPTQSSWAGRFAKPLAETRPNYYTDFAGDVRWNYAKPCETWSSHEQVRAAAADTLSERRPEMYRALLEKLDAIYRREPSN